ncbi:hypothetical protein CAEBREN_09448 [Caenorhabditis brenneri]|uniref:Seven TM Receptor n=1 Tax=Caenorhabditis brenneri TaxID=135651 RepID=G0MUI4_CAEBE|nr:hypothetical protein CAEBREN_09448 [Caenorhabditis brenneri]
MFENIFTTVTSYVNAILAILGNTLLIILILRKSPRSMGRYKYLMLIFSTFGIIFAIVDGTNQPMLHIHNGGYIIFTRNLLGLPRKVSFWYITLNCACYGMILLLLVFHFLYRYLALCKPHRLKLFSYPYFNILIVVFFVVSLEWWVAGIYIAGENVDVENHFRKTLLENYGLNRLDYTYASTLFYVSVFLIIVYFWLKIKSKMTKSALESQVISQRTLDMQRQLFLSLKTQTLLPVFFMFIPAGILLCFTLFELEMGPIEVVILPIITTQPFIDAIVPMYFIKDYRMAILEFLRRKKTNREIHTSSSQPDVRSANCRVFIKRT